MSEGMSEERLAVCRDLPRLIRRHAWMAAEDAADAIRDLAAEVDRLHAHLVAEHLATEAAETENDRLRAHLAEIGETEVEWAADGPGGWMQWPVAEQSEAYARRIVENATRVGLRIALKRRVAGQWREVPDA